MKKQKEKRLLIACEKLLKRLVAPETFAKCCPNKFSFDSEYLVKAEDLLSDGLESIRPRQELAAIKKLSGSKFFESEATEIIKNVYNRKFKSTLSKSATSKDMKEESDMSEDNDDDNVIVEEIEQSISSDSDMSEDPFDFITVQYKDSDGDYDM